MFLWLPVRLIAFYTAVLLCIQISGYGQSYGLTFSSHETVLEKRTSLDIAPNDSICFSKNFELGFDINFLPDRRTYFGYILRIISNGEHNIDLIYDQQSHSFRIINGENFSSISFTIDSLKLYKEWNRLDLKFNLESQLLSFEVNGKKTGSSNIPLNFRCFKFLWGANDFQKFKTRDIPSMKIKDIKIYENNTLKYSWPLNEVTGDTAYDAVTRKVAKVKNPNWIKPKYQQWELLKSFTVNGYAGVAFDPKKDKIYITGSDSLVIFGLNSDKGSTDWIPSNHENFRMGHQSIFDTAINKLYDIFIDQKKVVAFDFGSRKWEQDFDAGKITEFWHPNKFISKSDSSLYVIGGYGYLRYKNLVQRYSFASKHWEILKTSGDYYPPRYLSASAKSTDGNFVYLIGGYGSMTGDQMLDPQNFYDMYRYNIKERTFKRLFALKRIEKHFTFGNSLVIDPVTNYYYALVYPNDSSTSYLQLIRGSLTDSTFIMLGNSIPFTFHDIESFEDLYYSPLSNKLIAVELHYSKNEDPVKNTSIKIYSLNFVPEPIDITDNGPVLQHKGNIFLVVLPVAALTLAGMYFYKRRKSKNTTASVEVTLASAGGGNQYGGSTVQTFLQNSSDRKIHSSIFLFGQFQVFDKDGADITAHFTPLLKELFLIVCINTIRQGRGISSEMLNERLWHNKSEKDAKNNRSVNIAKLKLVLEKIGNCAITKESGSWQFHVSDLAIQIDFVNFNGIMQHAGDLEKDDMRSLMEIIKRGAFLYLTEYDWLDSIKSEISNSVIDRCLGYITRHELSQEPEFVIEITNCIFHFDHLNEDALVYQCKSLIILKRFTLASNVYQKFAKEYKDIYGTEFTKTFHETIA
jgi:two-component SAPR family response regulator